MIEYSLSRLLMDIGIRPAFVLGVSLGEYTAAAVAGAAAPEVVLESLVKQAEIIKSRCNQGFMTAILSNPSLYQQSLTMSKVSEMAGVNFANHFIVSGTGQHLPVVENELKQREILFQTLPVQYGFHSAAIDPAQQEYKEYLRRFVFQKTELSMISCLSRRRITEINGDFLWDVVRQPIHFRETVLEEERNGSFTYIDVGPSGTMANFIKNNFSESSSSQVYDLLTPFGQDLKKLDRIKEALQC